MLRKVAAPFSRFSVEIPLLHSNSCLKDQVRTTFVLRRKFAPLYHEKNCTPKKLKPKHYVYDLIRDTNSDQKPNIEVILTAFVDGLGNIGDRVSVRPLFGYNNLLLPGLALYATPENIAKHSAGSADLNRVRYSSSNALMMMKSLARKSLSVIMNKEHPWTLQPWHIKTSFRKCGFVVPEHAITLPEPQITGPDMTLENKEFYVTVTINRTEKVDVRCRLHHWSTEVVDRLPYQGKFWEQPVDPIHPEFSALLEHIDKQENVDH